MIFCYLLLYNTFYLLSIGLQNNFMNKKGIFLPLLFNKGANFIEKAAEKVYNY